MTKALGASGAATPVVTTASGKRHFSAATKAKMAAAQKARWVKLKGAQTAPLTPAAAPTKAKRKYSAEAKARWAKAKAGPAAKATVSAKPKRKLSAAGRANIIAATKARWARVNAAKAKAK